MASSMSKLYNTIRKVVNLAASYLKMRDERTNDVMEELERITTGVGLAAEEVQFPIEGVKMTDLEERLPCMVDKGGMKEVLRLTVEDKDEFGHNDITLEVWKKTRRMHVLVREIGTLHAITISWEPFKIPLNIVAIKHGECEEENCIMSVDCGDGIAFFVRQFDFAAFRVFFYEEGEITAGVRLLYMTVLDAIKFRHVSIEDFSQWSAGMVLDEIQLREPGDRIKRFTAEDAGLIPRQESQGDENLLDEDHAEDEKDGDKTLTEAIKNVLEEDDEESHDGRESADLGQSPELGMKGEKSKNVEPMSPGGPEILRNIEEEDDTSDLIDAIEFSGVNRFGDKVVLTTDQMRGIRSLLNRKEVDWSKEAVQKDAEEYDPVSFLKEVQKDDPEARLIKVKKSVHQPWIEEDKRRACCKVEQEETKSEANSHVSGREMWSEEEEDDVVVEEEEDEWDTEIMPNVTMSTEGDGESIKSPRAELSMFVDDSAVPVVDEEEEEKVDEEVEGEGDQQEDGLENNDEDSDERSPPAKKVIVQWTDKEERMALPAASRSADWSPVLAKIDDGRPVLDVSTSSESEEEFLRREGERIKKRDQETAMRMVELGLGDAVQIPDNDVYEQVVHAVYQDDADEIGDIDEDEGVSED